MCDAYAVHGGLRIAPNWRRSAASLVNLIVALLGAAAATAAGYAVQAVYERVGGKRHPSDAQTGERLRSFESTAVQRIALWLAAAGVGVLSRNSRGPGFRLLRLRCVDVQTGGPVSVRGALVGELFDLVWREVPRPLFRSGAKRQQDSWDALGREMKEIESRYAHDRQGRQQALMDFYKKNQLDPLAAFGRRVLPGAVWALLPRLWFSRGQSIRDRVTCTVVVVDP